METVRIFANKDFLCEKVAGLACIMFDYEAKQENALLLQTTILTSICYTKTQQAFRICKTFALASSEFSVKFLPLQPTL